MVERVRVRSLGISVVVRWLVVPVLVLGVLEYWADRSYGRQPTWFSPAEDAATTRPIDVIFFGRSFTAAAIDADAFADVLAAQMGFRPVVVSVARPWTTMAEYYLALRNLWRRYPAHLKGCVVFVEAPQGLPPSDTWDDPWVRFEEPESIIPFLLWSDLCRAWATANAQEQKLQLTTLWARRAMSLLSDRQRIRAAMLGQPIGRLRALLQPAASTADSGTRPPSELIDPAAGVQSLPATIERLRQRVAQHAHLLKPQERSVERWDRTILAEFVRVISARGGRVIFFRMPLSSALASLVDTPALQRDRDTFLAQARHWGTPLVDPGLQTTDADYPDLIHLSARGRRDYTAKLASAYLALRASERSLSRRDGFGERQSIRAE